MFLDYRAQTQLHPAINKPSDSPKSNRLALAATVVIDGVTKHTPGAPM